MVLNFCLVKLNANHAGLNYIGEEHMVKQGTPIKKKKGKRNELVLRLIWGFVGVSILLSISYLCLISESCNPFIVVVWCVVGLSFLMVAGLPCHKLVSVLRK